MAGPCCSLPNERAIATIDGATSEMGRPTNLHGCNELHARRMHITKGSALDLEVHKLAREIDTIWQAAIEVARETCDVAEPKFFRKFLCRGDKKKLMCLIEQGKQARTEYESLLKSKSKEEAGPALLELHETLTMMRQQRRVLTKAIRKHEGDKRKERFQNLYDTKQKLANAIVNNKKGDKVEPTVLKGQKDGKILYKHPEVLAETQRFFQELNAPP